jgi:hypothetical protein
MHPIDAIVNMGATSHHTTIKAAYIVRYSGHVARALVTTPPPLHNAKTEHKGKNLGAIGTIVYSPATDQTGGISRTSYCECFLMYVYMSILYNNETRSIEAATSADSC